MFSVMPETNCKEYGPAEPKKLSPDEELEKQYNDYKAQFEEWKERNKESVGTEAYIGYVKKFEDWERGVQKQRNAIRQKAEEEARRKAEAEKMARRRQEEAEAAAQRAAEQNRIANRQRRLVAAAAASTAAAAGAAAERQPQEISQPTALHRHSSATSLQRASTGQPNASIPPQSEAIQRLPTENTGSPMETSSMANVMQQMMNFMRDSEKQNGTDVTQEIVSDRVQVSQQSNVSSHYSHHEYHVQQQHQHLNVSTGSQQITISSEPSAAGCSISAPPTAAPVVQQQPPPETQAPPQLWGGEGASYAVTDPMFRRWNVRAAPANFCVQYEPPPPNVLSSPYWMLVEKMREKKLVLAPTFKNTIPPIAPRHPNASPAVNGAQPSPGKPPSLLSGPSVPPPPIGMPIPFHTPPPHAPPPFHTPHYHGARPPMYNVPPPNFRLPPPAAAAGGPPLPFYKSK